MAEGSETTVPGKEVLNVEEGVAGGEAEVEEKVKSQKTLTRRKTLSPTKSLPPERASVTPTFASELKLSSKSAPPEAAEGEKKKTRLRTPSVGPKIAKQKAPEKSLDDYISEVEENKFMTKGKIEAEGKIILIDAETPLGDSFMIDTSALTFPAPEGAIETREEEAKRMELRTSVTAPISEYCRARKCNLAILCSNGICRMGPTEESTSTLVYEMGKVETAFPEGSQIPVPIVTLAKVVSNPNGVSTEVKSITREITKKILQSKDIEIQKAMTELTETFPQTAAASIRELSEGTKMLNAEVAQEEGQLEHVRLEIGMLSGTVVPPTQSGPVLNLEQLSSIAMKLIASIKAKRALYDRYLTQLEELKEIATENMALVERLKAVTGESKSTTTEVMRLKASAAQAFQLPPVLVQIPESAIVSPVQTYVPEVPLDIPQMRVPPRSLPRSLAPGEMPQPAGIATALKRNPLAPQQKAHAPSPYGIQSLAPQGRIQFFG